MIIKIQDATPTCLTAHEAGLCDRFSRQMAGKSIATRRDGQDPVKVARDFGLGARAEMAFWKLLPWTSTEGPDIEAYEDRSRCSFAPDVGNFQVKLGSTYRGVTSWVFQKAHLNTNTDGHVALMKEVGGTYTLEYVLDYDAVKANLADMKKPSLKHTKGALYEDTLLWQSDSQLTLEALETRFAPTAPRIEQLSA